MEEAGWGSGVVIKNRTSAGCLIVRRKGEGGYPGADVVFRRKERKRPRLVDSEEESTDDELFDFYGRQRVVDQARRSSSVVYERPIPKESGFCGRKDANFGRNSLNGYESDQYNGLGDFERRHFDEAQARVSGKMAMGIGLQRDFAAGSTRGSLIRGRFDGKSKLPIPAFEEELVSSSSEAIRLQGKNGVLKVLVNHKNGMPKNKIRSSDYLEKKAVRDPNKFDQARNGKMKPESSIDNDEQSGDAKACKPTSSASKPKEGKVKRGSGTEKQVLREQIRGMLVNAGWSIDYRPRRNRDYFDAVYINPSGTAYWSIIKAYEAFQKQLKEVEGKAGADVSPFNPISDEVLSKLTRQTQKKLEKEMKKRKRAEAAMKRMKNDALGKSVNGEHESDSTASGSEEGIPSNKVASH